jgi:hypothetical protein
MSYLRHNRFIALLAGVLIAFAANTAAGQKPDGLALERQPEYLIEFHTADGCQFAPIHGPANRGVLIYALKRPDKYPADSSGMPINSMIAVQAEQTGEIWNIKVAVGVGEFYDAGARQLANFKLRTNERTDVSEGARFGLLSFRIGVVKVLDQSASKPRVSLKTSSISVEKLEASELPKPYRMVLKNNSEKDILAIQYNTYKDNQFLHLEWRSLPQPRPLIKSGGTYTFEVLSQDRSCGDAEGYHPLQSNRIEIASIVFVDGTYEGDSGLTALIRGRAYGNKTNLDRVIATLDNLNGVEEFNPGLLVYELKSLSDGMDEVADDSMAQRLRNGLPAEGNYSMSALTNFIRSGQHEVKTSLAWDSQRLERLIKTEKPEAIKTWCAQTMSKYKEWLALADAVAAH